MTPDIHHQIIEQAYKAAIESPGAAERFRLEYRAKYGEQRYRVGDAPGVTTADPTELLGRNGALSAGTSTSC